MSTTPNFASTPVVAKAAIAAATAANTGFIAIAGIPTSGVLILSGAATGTRIQSLNAQGGTTISGTLVLWMYDGVTSYPFDFFQVAAITPTTTGTVTPWQQFKSYSMLIVPSGNSIYVTTTITGQSAAIIATGATF